MYYLSITHHLPPSVAEKPRIVSIVSQVFEGVLESKVTCLSCKKVSVIHEPFHDLSLSIPGELCLCLYVWSVVCSLEKVSYKLVYTCTVYHMTVLWLTSLNSPKPCNHSKQTRNPAYTIVLGWVHVQKVPEISKLFS